jgi:hypothetical protein
VEISCRVYKPRRPRESPLCRLVEQHVEELLRVWPARFVRQYGPLRSGRFGHPRRRLAIASAGQHQIELPIVYR